MGELLYLDDECNTFVREIQLDGRWDLRHYSGRFYWEGPAVFCDKSEYQDVVRSTSVRVQTDDWGKSGMIVYPVAHGGKLLDAQESASLGAGHQGGAGGGEPVVEAPSAAPSGWPGPRGAEQFRPYPFTSYIGEGDE